MKHATLLLILAVAFTGTAFGHNGLTNFLPTVPDPLAINIDGVEDDWDWYDRDFANTDTSPFWGRRKAKGSIRRRTILAWRGLWPGARPRTTPSTSSPA